MAFNLVHLHTGWDVDQAIDYEKKKLVCIRFGHDSDETCMMMDQMMAACAEKLKNFVVMYVVDITEVPYYNKLYELNDPCSVMWFHLGKQMQIDLGTGENNKLNFCLNTKQEFIDICQIIYSTAIKGKGLAKSIINYASSDTRAKILR